MSMSVMLLLASFVLSLGGLFVFIASMTRGMFGTPEEGSRVIFCNAYLWNDQAITGQALVGVSIVLAVAWMLEFAARNMRRSSACHG